MKKTLRVNKVLVDWSQNDDHKTTICVYSLRAREKPTVSTPVSWEEVELCLKKRNPQLLVFEPGQVVERVNELGDLFEPVLTLTQKLPALDALEHALPQAAKDKAAKPTRPMVVKSGARKAARPGGSETKRTA
jgi:bifunctional non-homologous end joining protein LigD